MKAYVYRLYPSKAQERLMEEALETCRRFYNNCLAERKEAYEKEGRTVGKYEQKRRIKEYRAENPYAGKIPHGMLQVVVSDLDKAYRAFFRRLKLGEKPGFPRFRGRYRFDSFGLQLLGNGFKLDGRRLKLTGIGRVAVRWHRPIEGKIKTVRITRRADGWYACFACEAEGKRLEPTGQAVGIDVGITSLITTSDGEKVDHPHFYREGQRRLRVIGRSVARKKKGGTNRRKAVLTLKRHHQRVSNQRQDFLRKLAGSLVARYDFIAMEDLKIANMVRNRHLSKGILDAGWGYLVQQLTFKAAEAGRDLALVDPAYTSKRCSGCGEVFPDLTLAVRHVNCACGLSMDRDLNAAINILSRARGML